MTERETKENKFSIFLNSGKDLVLNSSINGFGLDKCRKIQNITVKKEFNKSAEEYLSESNISRDTLVFLTAVDVKNTVIKKGIYSEIYLTCGYENATSPMSKNQNIGTVNIFIETFQPLNVAGAVNLVIVATEAKSLAFKDQSIKDKYGQDATGTGTDSIAVFPISKKGGRFTGLHTKIGKEVGRLIYEACIEAIDVYKAEH